MIGWGRRVLLRHYLDEGLTVTEISRELGISRQTIYRWINEGELDRDLKEVRYGPQPPVPIKLDPYARRSIVAPRQCHAALLLKNSLSADPSLTCTYLAPVKM